MMRKTLYLLLLLLQKVLINAEGKCPYDPNNPGNLDFDLICTYHQIIEPHKYCLKPELDQNTKNSLHILTRIYSSKIPKLQRDTFTHTSTIYGLEIKNAMISEIGIDAFDKFSALRYLRLSNNEINMLDIKTFANIKQLVGIDLAFNNISKINEVFNSLENLTYLELSHNSLTSLESYLFHDLANLLILDLSSNKIMTLESAAFSDLDRLVDLSLQENLLSSIANETFSDLHALKFLNLSGNRINIISGFPFHLITLDLRGNPLICSSLFDLLKKLQSMDTTLIKGNTYIGIRCLENEGIITEEINKYITNEPKQTFRILTNATLSNNNKMLEIPLGFDKNGTNINDDNKSRNKNLVSFYILGVIIILIFGIFMMFLIYIKCHYYVLKLCRNNSETNSLHECVTISQLQKY